MLDAKPTTNHNTQPAPAGANRWRLWIIPLFAIAFLVFFIGPPLLGKPFGPYPLMTVADVLDLFTALVLIPVYWLLFRSRGNMAPGLKESLVFMVLAAFWVLGQGMHLAANSIGHLLENLPAGPASELAGFYDETLSHYLWHFGVIGLSAVIIYNRSRSTFTEGRAAAWPVIVGGIIYGFTYFAIIIEGATTPLGVTFAVLAVLFILFRGRKNLKQQPVLGFFLIAYLLAIIFFAGWGIYWKGLPEFSQIGII
jgi:hypothetical protein